MMKTAAKPGLRGRTVRFASAAAAFVYITAGLCVAVFAAALLSISASALFVLDNLENTAGWNGTFSPESKNVYQGKGALRITSTDFGDGRLLCLAYKNINPVDLSEYADGYIRFYLYVENENNLGNESQFELTSSGTCDQEETSWNISKNMLKDGWNTLYLSFESPGENAANLKAINYVRVYIHITGKNKVMLDELSVGTDDEFGITAAAVETSEPVKLPAEVYGEGGAVAAALAAMGTQPAETTPSDTEPAQTEVADTATPGAEAENASGSDSSTVNYTAIIAGAAAAVAVIAVIVVFAARRGKK